MIRPKAKTGWEPKEKKRKMVSGVLQPIVFQIRIIFADAGCISSRLQKSLIKDERVHLQTDDLVETAEVFDAPIIIGSDFPVDTPPNDSHMSSQLCHSRGIHATSWHIWYDEESWSVTQFRSVPMSDVHPRLRDHECAMMHLCHDRGYEIAVIFVKVLKGNAAAVDTLQLGYWERQEVLNVAFSFLSKSRDCPVIVAGDLGVGLSTVHAYIRKNALQEKVQTHCIKNQTFHTFFCSDKPGYGCTSINTDSQRMIAYQIEINSGDPHPIAEVIHRSKNVALTPRQKYYMEIFQQLVDGAGSPLPDSDDAHLTLELLYQPIAKQTRDKHGVVHTSAIDIDLSCNTFVSAILLLKKIRADVGAEKDAVTLTSVQFETALHNLKTIFEHYFRGAFSVWLRSLLGDKAFAIALLRHGTFEFSDLRRCARALRQGTSDDGGVSQSSRHTLKPELRRAAVSARREVKDAKKYTVLASQGWACSAFQKQQITLLQMGELAKRVQAANAAYGFGQGAEEVLSREQAMTLKVFAGQFCSSLFSSFSGDDMLLGSTQISCMYVD